MCVFTARWKNTASGGPTASGVQVLPGHGVCAELSSYLVVPLVPRGTWGSAWSGQGSAQDGVATFLPWKVLHSFLFPSGIFKPGSVLFLIPAVVPAPGLGLVLAHV